MSILSDQDLFLNFVSWKYLENFKSYGADTISILIITKGHTLVNIAHGVTVFIFAAHRPIIVYICTSFMKIS